MTGYKIIVHRILYNYGSNIRTQFTSKTEIIFGPNKGYESRDKDMQTLLDRPIRTTTIGVILNFNNK